MEHKSKLCVAWEKRNNNNTSSSFLSFILSFWLHHHAMICQLLIMMTGSKRQPKTIIYQSTKAIINDSVMMRHEVGLCMCIRAPKHCVVCTPLSGGTAWKENNLAHRKRPYHHLIFTLLWKSEWKGWCTEVSLLFPSHGPSKSFRLVPPDHQKMDWVWQSWLWMDTVLEEGEEEDPSPPFFSPLLLGLFYSWWWRRRKRRRDRCFFFLLSSSSQSQQQQIDSRWNINS